MGQEGKKKEKKGKREMRMAGSRNWERLNARGERRQANTADGQQRDPRSDNGRKAKPIKSERNVEVASQG
jgi:hypothetical protein